MTSILLLQGGQSAQTNTSNGYYVTTWKNVYCVTLLHTSQIQIIWIYISKLLCATLKRQKRGCNIRQLARFFFFCFCFLSSFKSGNVCRANMLFFSNTLLHCHSSTLSYLPGGSTAFCYCPLSSSMELLTRGWVTRGGLHKLTNVRSSTSSLLFYRKLISLPVCLLCVCMTRSL